MIYRIHEKTMLLLKNIAELPMEMSGHLTVDKCPKCNMRIVFYPTVTFYGDLKSVEKEVTSEMLENTIRWHSHSGMNAHWMPPSYDDVGLASETLAPVEILLTGAGIYIMYNGILPGEKMSYEDEHTEETHYKLMEEYNFRGRVDYFPWEDTNPIIELELN